MAFKLGTVSTGTFKEEDLFNAYLEALNIHKAKLNEISKESFEILYLIKDSIDWDRFEHSDSCRETLERLVELLQEVAPPFCYFGSHPGNGSDIGFWMEDPVDLIEQGVPNIFIYPYCPTGKMVDGGGDTLLYCFEDMGDGIYFLWEWDFITEKWNTVAKY